MACVLIQVSVRTDLVIVWPLDHIRPFNCP